MAAAARNPSRIFSVGVLMSRRDLRTAGRMPADPPVGAVTMMCPRAFSSPPANPYAATWLIALAAGPLAPVLRFRVIDAALLYNLIGPGRTPSVLRPVST